MSELHHTKEKTSPQDEQSNGKWSILEKLAGKYNESERRRVDKMKDTIGVFGSSEYVDKKIDIPPTTARKIGRMAMDLLGIHFPGSEKRRDKEAASIALNELADERAQKEEAERLAEEQRRFEQERIEEEKRRQEQEMLETDMKGARDALDSQKKQELHNQRAQEILERDLNKKLLKIDDIEDEVIAENPEVGKRTIPYRDKEIVVYDLKGIPFEMLSHTVDFKLSGNDSNKMGRSTAFQIIANPAEWTKTRDEAEEHYGFGTRLSDARGDVISCSYSNSTYNMSSRVGGRDGDSLIYGFGHVEADSVLSVDRGDGATSNMGGSRTRVSNPDEIKELQKKSRYYNEIVLRRYSETGIPKKPDYIIAQDGKISDDMLRHAKFFNIPIINIDTKVYEEKQLEKGKEIAGSITMNDEYEEINRKIVELGSLDVYKNLEDYLRKSIGRSTDIIRPYSGESPILKECSKVGQIEMEKRISFIEETMKKFIEQTKHAIKNGAPIPTKPDGFEDLIFSLRDIQSGGTDYSQYGIKRASGGVAPGNCNWIDFSFTLKDSPRSVTTSIYDGEHPLDPEEAIKRGTYTEKEFENADSSYYERIAPLIIEYCSLVNKPRS